MVSMAILPSPAPSGLSNERGKNNPSDKISNRGHTHNSSLNSELSSTGSNNAPSCKVMLQTALKKAQHAVEFDHVNDFSKALNCYQEALNLITNVLDSSPTFRSNSRLINIQTSYVERVALLSNLVSPKDDPLMLSNDCPQEISLMKSNPVYEDPISNNSFPNSPENLGTKIKETESNNSNQPCELNKYPTNTLSSNVDINNNSFSDDTHVDTTPENMIPPKKVNFNYPVIPLQNSRFSMPVFSGYKYFSPLSPESDLNRSEKHLKADRRRSMPPTSTNTPISSTNHSHSGSVSYSSPDTQSSRHSLSVIYEKGLNYNPAHRSWDLSLNGTIHHDDFNQNVFPQNSLSDSNSISSSSVLKRHDGGSIASFSSKAINLNINTRPSSFLLASSKVVDMAVSSQALSSHKSRQYNLITIQRVFREEPSENCVFETPPISNEFRVFWLMRSLERSMTVGGYLSKKLFIPRSVWHQNGVRLQSLEVKIHSCEVISEYLARFKGIDIKDTNQILKELEGLDSILNTVQNNLAKKLTFIEPLKRIQSNAFASLGNKITKSVEKIQMSYLKIKTDSSSLYIESLVKLFKASQFLEKWYQHFVALPPIQSSNIQIVARLNRVNGFLSNIICSFVLRDMSVMLAKYLKRLKLSINE
ncbi:hypothetical protein K502DRAFT_343397 [Neoconidiobolus thromboides FSU 785]|nr:hypothetical protein K502DRAFT_343397 [Neoconidiobolus thromboides FSU 785]